MQKIISSIVVASLALGISSAAWAKRVPAQNTQQQNTGMSATERVNRQVVEGNSCVSYADYATAMIDEATAPKHLNQRFSIVGETA